MLSSGSMWAERRANQTDQASAVSSPKNAYFKNKYHGSGKGVKDQNMSPFRKSTQGLLQSPYPKDNYKAEELVR
jgi:hypothetical protein